MPHSHPFAQVDVFGTTPYTGNPVAVVLDAEGLDEATMQQVARWTNLSETTFVGPPTRPGADYRVRIFTPTSELPFAGHPTLGTAHAWLEHGGRPRDADRIVQECDAGLIEVQRGDALSFAAPPTLRSGDLADEDLDRLAAALGIEPGRVMTHQWVDNGPGWAVIQLATAREVLDLEPDLSAIPEAMVGVIGAHPDGSPHRFEVRAFAPGGGVAEDPVCGSLNASVGQWLLRTGQVDGVYRVSQGSAVGRAGEITITPDVDGRVWVGGATTTLFRGTALV